MDQQKHWDLITKHLHHSLDSDETVEFEKTLEDKEVKDALSEGESIKKKLFNGFTYLHIDKDRGWRSVERATSKSYRLRQIFFSYSRYAAVFVIALLIGLGIHNYSGFVNSELSVNTVQVEWGQMSKLSLSDGTMVWLNSGTELKYPSSFNRKSRTVELDGEAQFRVTHDDKIPFEVKTAGGIIRVYGTTFNVQSYRDSKDLEVTLVEGKVTVETADGGYLATLSPSQQIRIDKETGKTEIKEVNTSTISSWIDGKILLRETKLEDLVKDLSRWYNVNIHLVGDDLGQMKISGTIVKGKPIDLFMKILESMYGIQYEINTKSNKIDEIIISKK